jgi:hypothetical protein
MGYGTLFFFLCTGYNIEWAMETMGRGNVGWLRDHNNAGRETRIEQSR